MKIKVKRTQKYKEMSFNDFIDTVRGDLVIEENKLTNEFTATLEHCFFKSVNVFVGYKLHPACAIGPSDTRAVLALITKLNEYNIYTSKGTRCCNGYVIAPFDEKDAVFVEDEV